MQPNVALRMLFAVTLTLVISCSTPLKVKRPSVSTARVNPTEETITSPEVQSQTRSRDTAAIAGERRRLASLREQMDMMQQQQKSLESRIDSVEDQLQVLRRRVGSSLVTTESSSNIRESGMSLNQSPTGDPTVKARTGKNERNSDVILPDDSDFDATFEPDAPKTPKSATRIPVKTPVKREVIEKSVPERKPLVQAPRPKLPPNSIFIEPDKPAERNQIADPRKKVAGGLTKAQTEDVFSKAMESFKKRQYRECISILNEANLQSAGSESQSRNNYWIGEAHYGMGQYEQAITAFKKTTGLPTTDKTPKAYIMIAESLLKLGRNEEAKKAYERVVRLYPQSAEAVRAMKRLQQI